MDASGLTLPARLFPALFLGLFTLAACGGSAESAADAGSTPLEEQAPYAEWATEEAAPTPEAPVESGAAPRSRASVPAPVQGTNPEPAPAPDVPAEEPTAPEVAAIMIPAGAVITATLEGSLSTRTHSAGDRFTARVREDVLASDGMVLVPQGARLEGLVAESRPSSDSQAEALMVLHFDAISLEGRRIPVVASVVEAEMESATADTGTRTAATIATGAAAGAVVGRILGRDTRSTVIGAAAGAAVGTGVALSTRDGHATLREGSRMVIRVDEAIYLTGR